MIAKAVHHISLCVPDLEAALGFYCDLLGLETIDRPEMGIKGAWLELGGTQLHLIVPPPGVDVGGPPENAPGYLCAKRMTQDRSGCSGRSRQRD